MDINSYEKLSLCTILNDTDGEITQRIVSELPLLSYGNTANRLIYSIIRRMVRDGKTITPVSVIAGLGDELETAGGEAYIMSLVNYHKGLRIDSPLYGYEEWIILVDVAGRLRQFKEVLGKYNKELSDLDRALQQYKTPEDASQFISNFITELHNVTITQSAHGYKHISEYYQPRLDLLDMQAEGFVVDVIPIGWPSFAEYGIPRPGVMGVIAGLTSSGKTQLADQIVLGCAMHLYHTNTEGHVTINTLEDDALIVQQRMVCCLMGLNYMKFRTGKAQPQEIERFKNGLRYINLLPIFLNDTPAITTDTLKFEAAAHAMEIGTPRFIGVSDYSELFGDKNRNEEQRIAGVARAHHEIARSMNSCEILLTQYSRDTSGVNNATKLGGLNARHSDSVAAASRWYIEIYNIPQMTTRGMQFTLPSTDLDERYAYCFVWKNSHGPLGQFPLEWTDHFTQFRDPKVPRNQLYDIPNST